MVLAAPEQGHNFSELEQAVALLPDQDWVEVMRKITTGVVKNVVFSAPAGGGKSTIAGQLEAALKEMSKSVKFGHNPTQFRIKRVVFDDYYRKYLSLQEEIHGKPVSAREWPPSVWEDLYNEMFDDADKWHEKKFDATQTRNFEIRYLVFFEIVGAPLMPDNLNLGRTFFQMLAEREKVSQPRRLKDARTSQNMIIELIPDPRVRERAVKIRAKMRELIEAKELDKLIPTLHEMNVEVPGFDEHSLELLAQRFMAMGSPQEVEAIYDLINADIRKYSKDLLAEIATEFDEEIVKSFLNNMTPEDQARMAKYILEYSAYLFDQLVELNLAHIAFFIFNPLSEFNENNKTYLYLPTGEEE